MGYPKYQINFMPESYYGYCSTACFMGVLNYFWYTQFNMKDTRDVMKIAKMGRYTKDSGLDEVEMGYALSRLGFQVTYATSGTRENELAYINDPVGYMTKKYENFAHKEFLSEDGTRKNSAGGRSFNIYDTIPTKQILESDEIEKLYEIDLVSIVKKYQNDDTLFILPLNWYALYDQNPQEGISGGHVVLCKGYENGMFEIYDPGPYKKPDFIPEKRVMAAMQYLFPEYDFIMVKNNVL